MKEKNSLLCCMKKYGYWQYPSLHFFLCSRDPSQLQVLREGSSCTGQDWTGHTPVAGGPEQCGCQEPALQPGGWRSRRPQEEVSAGAGGEARRCSVCETVSRVRNHGKRQAASGSSGEPSWVRMWRKGDFGTLMGLYTMENCMAVPQRIKNRTTMRSNNSIPRYISEENENTNSKRFMHPNVYSSTI